MAEDSQTSWPAEKKKTKQKEWNEEGDIQLRQPKAQQSSQAEISANNKADWSNLQERTFYDLEDFRWSPNANSLLK